MRARTTKPAIMRVPFFTKRIVLAMKKNLLLSLLAASFLAAGCATADATTATDRAEGDVLTGSRIPRKNADNPSGTKVIDGRAYEDYRRESTATIGPKGN